MNQLVPLGVAVLTVSDSRTRETDKSGALIVERLEQQGHRLVDRRLLVDDRDVIERCFREWVSDARVDVVIATGGTGITARDVTPEALLPLVSKQIPGFGELFRALSLKEIGTSTIQSRAIGAVCDRTLIFLLPGSTGGVRLGMDEILLPQLDSRTKPCNFAELLPRLQGYARG